METATNICAATMRARVSRVCREERSAFVVYGARRQLARLLVFLKHKAVRKRLPHVCEAVVSASPASALASYMFVVCSRPMVATREWISVFGFRGSHILTETAKPRTSLKRRGLQKGRKRTSKRPLFMRNVRFLPADGLEELFIRADVLARASGVSVGSFVQIIAGAFKGFSGRATRVDEKEGVAEVEITILGRTLFQTVALEVLQV